MTTAATKYKKGKKVKRKAKKKKISATCKIDATKY